MFFIYYVVAKPLINIFYKKVDREALFQVEIVDYLLKELKLGDLFTEDEVQKCIGTVRINAIRSTEYHDRGR